jgi:hypothetical protein
VETHAWHVSVLDNGDVAAIYLMRDRIAVMRSIGMTYTHTNHVMQETDRTVIVMDAHGNTLVSAALMPIWYEGITL